MKEKDFNELKEMLTEIVDECLNEIRKFGYCEVAGMEDYQKQVVAEVYGYTLYETLDGDIIAPADWFDEEDLDGLKSYQPKQKEDEVSQLIRTMNDHDIFVKFQKGFFEWDDDRLIRFEVSDEDRKLIEDNYDLFKFVSEELVNGTLYDIGMLNQLVIESALFEGDMCVVEYSFV
ncbi:MAG: hypothetical protein J6Y78_01870 [Paludibacteraceae bacterium]|nr:hypothetical protein [Paludibacteraceae bacterium]